MNPKGRVSPQSVIEQLRALRCLRYPGASTIESRSHYVTCIAMVAEFLDDNKPKMSLKK